MNQFPLTIWIGVAIAGLHMALCHVLLERIKRENKRVFEEMGSFHLFWNNTPRSTWLFWKWIFSSGANQFTAIVRILTWVIRLISVLFLIWFAVQVGTLLST